ncbi:MAG TPA: hypothetical protein VN920_13055 [Pyrinomonadaceae bacterium]|nr:hypothetical protein [Pyrinomonadaceae bacterium]
MKIENARLLLNVDPTKPPISQYRLRNGGTKPIHYFTIVAWSSNGTGGTLGNVPPWDGRITNRLLMPGQIVPTVKRNYDPEIVPLTSDLREKLGLTGPLKLIVVLLVDQITFSDGSTYSNVKSSKALLDYFETLTPKD